MKDLRDMWKRGTPTFGPFVGLNAPGICEILGHAGFDYCIIDLEHGAIDLETAENMVRGANAAGIAPIIRVGSKQRRADKSSAGSGSSRSTCPNNLHS